MSKEGPGCYRCKLKLGTKFNSCCIIFPSTVKLVFNDQTRDPKFLAVVDSWSLLIGRFFAVKTQTETPNGSHCEQVVAIRRWSLA